MFDMACGWLMYRAPYKDGFRYVCGLYGQSHGQACSHDHIDGMIASRFLIGQIQQRSFAAGAGENSRPPKAIGQGRVDC